MPGLPSGSLAGVYLHIAPDGVVRPVQLHMVPSRTAQPQTSASEATHVAGATVQPAGHAATLSATSTSTFSVPHSFVTDSASGSHSQVGVWLATKEQLPLLMAHVVPEAATAHGSPFSSFPSPHVAGTSVAVPVQLGV